VSSLKIDNVVKIASTSYGDSGYLFRGRELFFRNGTFTKGLGNVEVSYTAGYSIVPEDLAQAICEVVVANWKTKDQLGWSSKSLAGESISISLDLNAYSKRVKQIVDSYSNILPL
jgi:hypothetical protein